MTNKKSFSLPLSFSRHCIALWMMLFMIIAGDNSLLWSQSRGTQILQAIDQQQQLSQDITAKLVLLQTRPVQGTRRYEMAYYRQDKTDSFLIVMLAPNQEKGNGYLKVKDNFWLYRKNTRTFQHIARDENIAGTDIQGADLETRKTSDLYQVVKENGAESIKEAKLGAVSVYLVKIITTAQDVTYPKQTLHVRKDNYLLLKVENYTKSDVLMLTQLFPKYTKIQGRYIPVMGYNIDEFEKGNKTVFQITDVSLKPISKNVFTKAYLENLSR